MILAAINLLADLGLERSPKAERGLVVWAAIIVFFASLTLYLWWRRTRRLTTSAINSEYSSPVRGTPFMRKTFFAVVQVACGVLIVYGIAKFAEPKATRPPGWQLITPPHEVTVLAQQGGLVWAGGGEGLFVVNSRSRRVIDLPQIKSRDLRGVRALLSEERQLWIGCRAGLLRYDGSRMEPMLPPQHQDLGPVTALCRTHDRNLWIGAQHGVWRANPELTDWRWFGVNDGLDLPSVDVIYQARDGVVWLGSNAPEAAGLFRYEPQNASFSNVSSGLGNHAVNDLAEDHNGVLWVATGFGSRGAAASFSKGQWREITEIPGIAGEKVRSLFQDSRRQFWFCSEYNGVAIRSDNAWRRLTTREGLPGMEVKDMIEDSTGALWLGTERGLGFMTAIP